MTQNDSQGHELVSMSNLRECLRSAADVASSASSTLTVEMSDNLSLKHGSDFGDVFTKDSNETMQRWMSSHTVYEYDEINPLPDPSEASTGDVPTEYQSDSDSDIENEMIRALFTNAKKLKADGDLAGAERKFRNCLSRFSSSSSSMSLASLKSISASGVSKAELLELLTDTYCLLGSWSQAKATMVEKLSFTERQVGKKDELYLWDTMKLSELMMKNKEYVEAHLQGRRCLRGFKKLGESGQEGYEKCLVLLVSLCSEEGKIDEEEAYAALLGSHQAKLKRTSVSQPRTDLLPAPTVQVFADSYLNSSQITLPESPVTQTLSDTVKVKGKTYGQPRSQQGEHSGNKEYVDVKPWMHDKHFRGSDDWKLAKSSSAPHRGEIRSNEDYSRLMLVENISAPIELPASEAPVPIKSSIMGIAKSGKHPQLTTKKPVQSAGTVSIISPTTPLMSTPQVHEPVLQFDAHHSAPQLFWEKPNYSACPVDNFKSQLFRSGFVDMAMKGGKPHTALELIIAYCKQFHGHLPYISTEYLSTGWRCIVKINDTHGCEALRHQTEELSVQAAVTKTCEVFIPSSVLEALTSADPYSDKEVVPLVDKSQWKEVASSSVPNGVSTRVPYITVSSENHISNRIELPTRSASDSMYSRNDALGVITSGEMTTHRESGPLEDLKKHRRANTITSEQLFPPSQGTEWTRGDDQHFAQPLAHHNNASLLDNTSLVQYTGGRDLTASQMNEQAAITLEDVERISDALGSAEGAAVLVDMIKGSTHKLCPICKTKPWNVPDDRLLLNHADRCLQVHLLTGRNKPKLQQHRSEEENSTVVRPTRTINLPSEDGNPESTKGTWACSRCKSTKLQFLTHLTCISCGRLRNLQCPSSTNNFTRQPFDQYRTILTSLDLQALITNDGSVSRRKILLLGDGRCGKTRLTYTDERYRVPISDFPVNIFAKRVDVEGRQLDLEICDPKGGYERPDRSIYNDVHVVLLCFDICRPSSWENIQIRVSKSYQREIIQGQGHTG
jgi:hypothetical protein